MTSSKNPDRLSGRTKLITAASIVAVGLASTFAIGAETGGLTIVRENMHYTAANLLRVWPSRYPATAFGRAKARRA